VQNGVEQRRVNAERFGGIAHVLAERDLGENIGAAPPYRVQATEQRAVVVSLAGQLFIEVADFNGLAAARWPIAEIDRLRLAAQRKPPGSMMRPVRVHGVVFGSGVELDGPTSVLAGRTDGDLERDPTKIRQHQRGVQRQLLHQCAADLASGMQGHLHERRARQHDHTRDGVVGQPGMRP
jgi:hypothetical protein